MKQCIETLEEKDIIIKKPDKKENKKTLLKCESNQYNLSLCLPCDTTSSPGLFPKKLREKPWGRGCVFVLNIIANLRNQNADRRGLHE